MSDPSCVGCDRTSADGARLLSSQKSGLFLCDQCTKECAEAIADAPTRIPGGARACGFCGKTEDVVAVMVVVGSKLVCDECVDQFAAQQA